MNEFFNTHFTLIPKFLEISIIFWFLFSVFVVFFLCIRLIILKNIYARRIALRERLLDSIQSFLGSGDPKEIPPECKNPKFQDTWAFLLLDLLEKFTGKDHERLLIVVKEADLSQWIKRNIAAWDVKRIQRGLMLQKHLRDQELLPLVAKRCHHHHTITRILAKEVYALTGGVGVITNILDSLRNENVEAQRQIIEELTLMTQEIVPSLSNFLVHTKDPDLQIPLIEALEVFGRSQAAKTVLNLLTSSKHEGVQWVSFSYFITHPMKEALKVAEGFLYHPREEFRLLALTVLTSGAAEGLDDLLISKIDDTSWRVQYFVGQHLMALGKKGAQKVQTLTLQTDHPSSLLMQRVVAEHRIGLKPPLRVTGRWLPV